VHPIYHTANLHSSTSAQEESEEEQVEQAEQAAQRPKVLDATILEHITEAFIALDRQWCITYCNQKAAALMQGTKEELPGKNVWEMFPEIVGTAFYRRCQKSVATGIVEQFEVRSRRHQKWIHIYIVPSPDDITIFLRDITLEKQAKEQQQFQANILQHIRDSVIVTDLQGRITYWNEGAGCIFGYTPEEMIGQTLANISLGQNIGQIERNLEHIAAGQDYKGEWQGRRKDGATVWVDVITTLLRNEDGEACGFLSVAKDITERKRAEEELRRSRDQLEVILKNVDDGIIVQDATGKIIYANHVVAIRAGYASAEEMLAAPPSAYWARVDLTDEQGRAFPFSQLPGRRAMQGEVNPQVHVRYVNKQTHEVGWTLIKSTVVFERDHTPLLVISVLQDTTQFKELEQSKDEFILHVSHELRTPLTALAGFLELLNEYSTQLNEQTKAVFLSRSLENCQELICLVNAVLDVLQIKHDVQPAQPKELALACLVREVIEQLDPRTVQEYALQVNIPEQLTVWADEQYLRQVLRNLLSNACKYAPEQTSIVVNAVYDERLERENPAIPQIRISIQDAGPGIPPAEQALLFERFARLKRDIASKVRGTGLGLYICKQLVEKMGGHIWVESSGQAGEGSRFCFTLPLSPPLS
jgi:PAS domain S-box-containing protein